MKLKGSPIVRRRLLAVLIVLLLFIQGATIPFKHTLRFPCYLAPVTIWTLKSDGAGQITAVWQKSILEKEISYSLFQFERPDVVEIQLESSLHEGSQVRKGEILGWIYSRESGQTLLVTSAELEHARAEESALKAGGRPEDLEIEWKNLQTASVSFDVYKPEYERIKQLYEQGLASLRDFQQSEGQYKVLAANLELAEARVKALQAGAREEDIRIAQAQVEMLEKQVNRVREIMGKETPIISPFDGVVRLGGDPNVLLTLHRTDTLDVTLVTPETYAPFVQPGRTATVCFAAAPFLKYPVSIYSIDFLSENSIGVRAHCLIPNPDHLLIEGMFGEGKILTDPITVLESLRLQMGRINQSWMF